MTLRRIRQPVRFNVAGSGPQPSAFITEDFNTSDSGVFTALDDGGAATLVFTNDYAEGNYAASPGGENGQIYLQSPDFEDRSEFYAEFSARMPGATGGCKFFKAHGQDTSFNYANCTFGLEADTGLLDRISFGDGTNNENDTQNIIKLDGTQSSLIGRSFGSATVLTPQSSNWGDTDWGTGWHTFKFYVKFNSGTTSGNEVADGEFYLEIDGDVYVDATGLFNRHYSNLPIEYMTFFDYAQNNDDAFGVDIDDIVFSDNGFMVA